MSKKAIAVGYASKHLEIVQCPLCATSFTIKNASFICREQHTFDFAKQGYVNVLTHLVQSNYDKTLFSSRHHIIAKEKLYQPMHKAIANIINERYKQQASITIADLGCGEGSHLKGITNEITMDLTQVGIDIAKEGILKAAKTYPDTIWLVGDLANMPLRTGSIDVLLNIFSPANYMEFKRIAAKGALCIKVVPGPHYLRELREFLGKKQTNGDAPATLFAQRLSIEQILPVHYTRTMDGDSLSQLVQMTPLTWKADPNKMKQFTEKENQDITIDVNLLIGSI